MYYIRMTLTSKLAGVANELVLGPYTTIEELETDLSFIHKHRAITIEQRASTFLDLDLTTQRIVSESY